MAVIPRQEGDTGFGDLRVESSVAVDSKAGTASALILVDSDGVEWVVWVDTTGDLRIGTRANRTDDPNANGTIVGTQS